VGENKWGTRSDLIWPGVQNLIRRCWVTVHGAWHDEEHKNVDRVDRGEEEKKPGPKTLAQKRRALIAKEPVEPVVPVKPQVSVRVSVCAVKGRRLPIPRLSERTRVKEWGSLGDSSPMRPHPLAIRFLGRIGGAQPLSVPSGKTSPLDLR
jgi:hypothetical protein